MPRNAQPGTRSNKTFNDGMRTACDTLGFSGLPPAAGFGGMASYAAGFVSWPLRTSLNAPCHLWRLQLLIRQRPTTSTSRKKLQGVPRVRLVPVKTERLVCSVWLLQFVFPRQLRFRRARQADAGVLLHFVFRRQLRFRRARQADASGVESGES